MRRNDHATYEKCIKAIFSIGISAFTERSRKKNVIETLEWCSRTIPSFEIISVNDGRTDDTLDIARSLSRSESRVNVLAPHLGKGAAVE